MARTPRLKPRDSAPDWPAGTSDDPGTEVALRFARRLREAIGDRSVRHCAALAGLSHVTLLDVLSGNAWPDMATISKLEVGLDVDLWPGRLE